MFGFENVDAVGEQSRQGGADEGKSFIIDMDGVLIKDGAMIPGADRFISHLNSEGVRYLVLTNNPIYTPGDLADRLLIMGLDISADRIFTSAMATALFLQSQQPMARAFVIGEAGLTEALHGIGYVITEHNPRFVVLGETLYYNLESVKKAIRLIVKGAHFIATNPDPTDASADGLEPACGAMAALIERATGVQPYFVGKPNPLMLRTALNYLGVHSENTVMVGDRMDTDVVSGVEAGMETVLVLTGVTDRDGLARFPYQPTHVVESLAEIDLDGGPHS